MVLRAQMVLRKRLDRFVEQAFRTVHRDKIFEREAYLENLCFVLQRAAEAQTSRCLINMPPRMLKSFSAAVCLPAFVLGRDPSVQIGIATYGEELAREHMRLFKAVISQRWFRTTFPEFKLAPHGSRWDNFTTTQQGGLRAVTVGGSFTGIGVDILIMDDLLKAQDAKSEAMREAALSFYENTALTRINDKRRSRIIVVQQRLHEYDISAQLIERGFEHLNLPAVFDRDVTLPCYNGFERTFRAGELLSPVRHPRPVLDDLLQQMGPAAYSSQFLQKPLPDASMMIDMARLHLIDKPFRREDLKYVVISVDPAVKITEDCDFSVLSTFGYDGKRWCLMNVVRARLDFPALKGVLIAQREFWKSDVTIIEDTHTGEALWREVGARDGDTITRRPEAAKEERMNVATGRLYTGEIVFPRSEEWSGRVFDELRAFPGGRHDDIVDTISQFVGWLNEHDIGRLLDGKNGRRPSNAKGRPSRPRDRTDRDS